MFTTNTQVELEFNIFNFFTLNYKTIRTISIFFTIALLIVGFIGVGLYVSETKKTKTYRESKCLVEDSYVYEKTCSRQECSGSTDDHECETDYYD